MAKSPKPKPKVPYDEHAKLLDALFALDDPVVEVAPPPKAPKPAK